MPSVRTDPLRNFKFRVKIDKALGNGVGSSGPTSLADAGFMSVSGLGVQTEVIPYREGGMNTTTRKLPGQSDFPPIQLQRGLFDASHGGHAFWEWMKQIFALTQGEQGTGTNPGSDTIFRTDLLIKQMAHPVTQGNVTRSPRVIWKVYNAWPSSVNFSDLDAGGNAVAVEQIVFAHEGIDCIFRQGQSGGWSRGSFTPDGN